MNSTAQAWEIARDIATRQGTGSKEWYGLAHYILTLPERIEPIEQENEMNELSIITSATMTSKEIAVLTGKRHADVLRDIRIMLTQVYDLQDNADLHHVTITGIAVEIDPQTKRTASISLDKDHTLTLLTGYDAKSRFKVMVRWQELEERIKAPALPDFSDPAAAARAWADQYEAAKKAAIALEAAQPAIEFHERVGDDEGLHSIDEVAKALNAPPMKFRAALKKELDLFRLDGLPKQTHINNGYMRVIETVLPNGRIYPQPMFTGKGMIWVQQRLDHNLMGVQI